MYISYSTGTLKTQQRRLEMAKQEPKPTPAVERTAGKPGGSGSFQWDKDKLEKAREDFHRDNPGKKP